jgi:hypothetical protein
MSKLIRARGGRRLDRLIDAKGAITLFLKHSERSFRSAIAAVEQIKNIRLDTPDLFSPLERGP